MTKPIIWIGIGDTKRIPNGDMLSKIDLTESLSILVRVPRRN